MKKRLQDLLKIGLPKDFAKIVCQTKDADSYDIMVRTEDFCTYNSVSSSSLDVTIDIQSSSCTNYIIVD